MKYARIIFVVLVFILISAFFHFYFPGEGDGDIFYHFRHAEIYAEKGIFYSEFQWLPQTIIGENSSDIWYGFHLFLIPFTFFGNLVFGIKMAGVFVTAILLLLFYFSLKFFFIKKPFFWTIFMFFSVPGVMFHLLLIRPHAVSTGLAALLLPLLIYRHSLGIFLTSFFIAFIHLNVFWVVFVIFGVVFLINLFREKAFLWKECFYALAGVLAGWFLRPNPFGALKITYANVFGVSVAKLNGIALNLGAELRPLAIGKMFLDFWPFLIFWLTALFTLIFYRKKFNLLSREIAAAIFAGGLLSFIFFLATIFFASRSYDLWLIFGTIFAGFVFTYFVSVSSQEKNVALNIALFFFACFIIIRGIYAEQKNMDRLGWDIYMFKDSAEWISKNSAGGETVFNASWDYFPLLFFWNTKNRYTSAMDPIMLYAHSEDLYKKSEALRLGDDSNVLNTLKNFNARFIFLTKANEPKLYENLSKNQNFERGYEDSYSAIFELK